MNRIALLLLPLLTLVLPAALAAQDKGKDPPADKVDFTKQVLPILEKRCFKCHSSPGTDPGGRPRKPKGGVILDTKEGITTSKKGKLVVAKKPAESRMIEVVSLPPDDEDHMPPKKEGDSLAKEDIDALKKWIEQGASFGDWTGKKKDDKGKTDKPGEKPATGSKPGDKPPAGGKPGEKPKGEGGKGGGLDDETAALAAGLPALGDECAGVLTAAHARLEPLGDTHLLRVSFFGNEDDVTDATLQALLPAKEHIVELRLARTGITDAAGTVLAQLPRLQQLDLRETKIGDACVQALGKLEHLRSLNLFGTKVGDAGLAALSSCASLRQLYVWQTPVSAAAVVALGEQLPQARIVFTADLPDPLAEGQGGGRGRRGGK